jgi:hypothetical protein
MFNIDPNLIITFPISTFEISGIIIQGDAEKTGNRDPGFTVKINKADVFCHITAFTEDLMKIFNDIPSGNFDDPSWRVFLGLEPFINHFEFLKTFTA